MRRLLVHLELWAIVAIGLFADVGILLWLLGIAPTYIGIGCLVLLVVEIHAMWDWTFGEPSGNRRW